MLFKDQKPQWRRFEALLNRASSSSEYDASAVAAYLITALTEESAGPLREKLVDDLADALDYLGVGVALDVASAAGLELPEPPGFLHGNQEGEAPPAAAALLAGSIALHQPAESLALVVALLRAGLRGPKLLRLLLLFTAMGPLGCVAGLGLHARFGKLFGGALDGALIALTAGTFVYVGATEVVPEEFEDGAASRAKVVALLLGVATILGLARVADLLEARAG